MTVSEKCNIAEALDKDFKMAITNICKDLKEDINKWLGLKDKVRVREVSENTNSGTRMKIVQDMK